MLATRATYRQRERQPRASERDSGESSRQRGHESQAGSGAQQAGFLTYVLATILITAALLFYVYLRVGSLQLGYLLTSERQQQLKLVLDNRALKTEIGTLSAPGRIRRMATEKLGMVPAERIIDLTGGG